jgi:hypothetical protein
MEHLTRPIVPVSTERTVKEPRQSYRSRQNLAKRLDATASTRAWLPNDALYLSLPDHPHYQLALLLAGAVCPSLEFQTDVPDQQAMPGRNSSAVSRDDRIDVSG